MREPLHKLLGQLRLAGMAEIALQDRLAPPGRHLQAIRRVGTQAIHRAGSNPQASRAKAIL